MGTDRHAYLFKPGAYGTTEQPLQAKVGYYTEVAGLGASPDRRRRQRQDRGLQPLPGRRRHRQLPRAGQLLAHPVEPLAHHQRGRPGRLPVVGELLGGLPGGVDAPAEHHRRRAVADGLLHRRPAVRQRRLHRRLAAAGHHQRLPAAVAHPQQRGGRLVQRRVEPGLRRRRGRAGRRRRSPTRRTPPSTPRRSAGRSRTCSSTARAATTCGCPPRSATAGGVSWADGHHPGPDHLDRATSSSPSRPTRCASINSQLARGKNLLLTPGVYDIARSIEIRRAEHGGARHRARHPHRGQRRHPAGRRGCPRRDRRGRHHRRRHRGVAASCCGSGRQHGHNASSPTNPTTLSDVYFRVGGPHIGQTDTALEVNSDNVLIDHTWVWRGDHGVEGFTEGVNGDTDRWSTNTGRVRRRHQRRQRDRHRPVRRALPAVQHRLERRARHHDPLPERAAVRPADAGRLDERHGRGLRRLQGRRPGAARTTCTAAGSTSSTRTTRRSTPRTASRSPTGRASSCTTS